MGDWKDIILGYYQILQIAVEVAKVFKKIKKAFPKEYDIKEIRDNLSSCELHFGDKITVIGTFSEYLPFIDPKRFLTGTIPSSFPRTARLKAINDMYCGALFKPEQTDALASEVLPIFYGLDSKVLEHYTGEMLELKCQIIQVPAEYKDIINQNSYFTFEKEAGLSIPFGLKVLAAEPYGLVDSFEVNAWLIGNLNPAPHLRNVKKNTCGECQNFFSYMQIEPVNTLLNFGCANYHNASKELIESSRKFFELEKNKKPYMVFPEIFSQFEIFYPSVDILNEEQKDHSANIILGAIAENMERLFRIPIYGRELILPKESILNVDFQYDQLNPITSQTFDPTNVPKWECPHYTPDPNKLRKKKTKREEAIEKRIDENTKKIFKLKRAF
ncbi:hypothetical protein MUO79_08600 [Candidatus Bathyarchaeota archaeon]|nr:hypothetical protein [Candidatus Bathyarchaeota archaeon]